MVEPLQAQSLLISDFSGGITDNTVGAAQNQYEKADNFVLVPYGNKAKLISRPGSTVYDTTYSLIPAGNQRVGSMFENESQLFVQSLKNLYYISSGWNTLTGPSGNTVFSTSASTNYASYATWNKHTIVCNDALIQPQKVFKDSGGTYRVHNLGLPLPAATPSVSTTVHTGKAFVYAFIYTYTYTIGTVTFKEYSSPVFQNIINADAPNTTAVSITGIPVLSNGVTDNYDTSNISVEIYRTVDAGTTFYYVKSVTNGTVSASDTMSDATLQTSTTLYTNGGVLANDQPPKAKYVIQAGEITWYLHCQEGSSVYPNRMRPSKPSAPAACPGSFAEDLDDEIVGGGVIGTTPIVMCKNHIYRIEGFYDEAGRGSVVKREIYRVDGCVSHRSIVAVPGGLTWAGKSGFYFTDGNTVTKISTEINTSYAKIVATDTLKGRINGTYDPINNWVLWACQQDQSSSDNDIVYVAYPRWFNPEGVPFTTWTGGLVTDNFAPTCLIYSGGNILRGDRRGYVFKHASTALTDPKVDTTVSDVTQWLTAVITYDHRTAYFDFGSSRIRKWVPRVVITADNQSNLSLQIYSNNDKSGLFKALAEVRSSDNLTWGDVALVWGTSTLNWNLTYLIEQWRRFPAGSLRCVYKQLKFTNAYTTIDKSDNQGTATVNASAKTVTLDSGSASWASDAVDYYLSFDNDSYVSQYKVTARTSTTATVLDSNNTLVTGSHKWLLRGYRRGEIFSLLEYAIDFAPLTMTQQAYPGNTASNA
jgi:hypothetical protein